MAANFQILKKLGEGGFGEVFLIEDKSNPSKQLAMKVMKLGQMDEDEVRYANQEVALLESLKHPYLLKYVNCFRQNGQICLVTEFCPNGDLDRFIRRVRKREGRIEEDRLLLWFKQIASAVEYLHGKNVIHRDLKVQNVFLDADMDCKLGDLGIARVLESAHSMAQTMIGTYHYMSPEIYFGIPYSAKTDIWSLGIVMFELASLEKPFNSFFLQALIHKITCGKKPSMPTGYNEDFRSLLSTMLEKDPDDRPSAGDVLKHKVFKRELNPSPLECTSSDDEVDDDDDDDTCCYHDHDDDEDDDSDDDEDDDDDDDDNGAVLPGVGFQFVDILGQLLMTLNDLTMGTSVLGATGGSDAETHTLRDVEEEDNEETMDIVERTLVSMGHIKGARGFTSRKERMKEQMKMLETYCLETLNNDRALFDRASAAVDSIQGDDDMEEKLIDVLGHENFGLCGVQFVLYKNYQHNLIGL